MVDPVRIARADQALSELLADGLMEQRRGDDGIMRYVATREGEAVKARMVEKLFGGFTEPQVGVLAEALTAVQFAEIFEGEQADILSEIYGWAMIAVRDRE